MNRQPATLSTFLYKLHGEQTADSSTELKRQKKKKRKKEINKGILINQTVQTSVVF